LEEISHRNEENLKSLSDRLVDYVKTADLEVVKDRLDLARENFDA
jgi:hypothetical protein